SAAELHRRPASLESPARFYLTPRARAGSGPDSALTPRMFVIIPAERTIRRSLHMQFRTRSWHPSAELRHDTDDNADEDDDELDEEFDDDFDDDDLDEDEPDDEDEADGDAEDLSELDDAADLDEAEEADPIDDKADEDDDTGSAPN